MTFITGVRSGGTGTLASFFGDAGDEGAGGSGFRVARVEDVADFTAVIFLHEGAELEHEVLASFEGCEGGGRFGGCLGWIREHGHHAVMVCFTWNAGVFELSAGR